MITIQLEDKVNSQVTLSKQVYEAAATKAKELGITKSRLINTICYNALILENENQTKQEDDMGKKAKAKPKAKPVMKKQAGKC